MIPRKSIAAPLLLLALGAGPAALPPAASSLLEQGDRLAGDGKTDKALEAYRRALDAARSENDSAEEASALFEIGDHEKDYARAREAFDACVTIREKLGDPKSLGFTLNVIGNLEFARGAHDEALELYGRALPLRREAGDRLGAAGTLSNIGAVYRVQGDYAKAIECLEPALQELQALGKLPNAAITLNNLAVAYGHLGDYPRALDYSGQQLAIVEKLENKTLIAAALNARGILETWRGDYRAALAAHDRALTLRRELESRWGVAESSNNMGLVHQAQGDHTKAIGLFTEAIRLSREIGNQSLEGDGHRNLGREYLATGRPMEAVAEFQKGYELGEATGEKVNMAVSLDGIGRARLATGHPADAVEPLDRAIAIQSAIGEGGDLVETRVQRAIAARELGRLDESLRYAREAADFAASIDAPESLWKAHFAAGKALEDLGKTAEAASEFDAAIRVVESQRLRVAGSDTVGAAYFADRLAPYRERMALALGAGQTGLALELAERSKARALADILASGRLDIGKSLTAEERRKERDLDVGLTALRTKLGRLAPGSPAAAGIAERLRTKRGEREAFEAALYAAHPDVATDRGEAPPLSSSEMMRLAGATGATILDYAVGPKATYLFVLRPGAAPKALTIPLDAGLLRQRADELRRQLSSRDLAFAKTSRETYDALIGPAARLIGSSRTWVVVPDGPLWEVPFSALESGTGHFIVEDVAIAYCPSLTVLRETGRRRRASPAAKRGLLALGNPKTPLPPLPEAERQVREIGALYRSSGSEVLVGESASEHVFKAEAPAFRVLHLASHAVLDDADPMYSHVLLAEGGGDDGRLEARKLMDLDLHAEMLVLSGCETARGDAPAGEGMTGMLWASFVAGVPTTVASLWRVESSSTSELMIEFHRQWLANRGKRSPFVKAEALRAAARKLIASGKYAHPFYWAGFILAGSPG